MHVPTTTRLKLLDDIKLDLLTTSTKVKHLGSKHYTIDVTLVVTLLIRQQHLVSTALTFTVLLSQLISTRGGEHNSSDEKLNKQRVLCNTTYSLQIQLNVMSRSINITPKS